METVRTDKKTFKDRLKNCINMAYEILNVGTETNEELERQGEQLDRISNKTSVIDTNVANANKTLNNMSSYFRSLLGSAKYDIAKVNTTNIPKKIESNEKNEDDNSEEFLDLVDVRTEEDKHLDELYDLTIRMKQMSLAMNKALDEHNEKIECITGSVDKTNKEIKGVNHRINKLM